jgi:hypothetical protein
MEACVHRMLYCSAVQSSVDEFRSQDFGLKLNWEAPMGSDWCILFCLQNGTLTRPVVIGLQSHACSGIDVQVESMRRQIYGEAGSGHEDSSHNILTLMPCRFCLGPR